MANRIDRDDVARNIVRRDPAFRELVRLVGPPPNFRPARVDDRFAALVRSITYQLLATKAAHTIHQRVIDTCGGTVDIHTLLAISEDDLRGAGLSRAKATSMLELAQAVARGELKLERHGRMTNDDITNELVAIRGIGPWTTHMYLMFTLARSDVWPTGDYGVRSGWTKLHGLDEMVTEKELGYAGDRFIGNRSAVAWYCWRAVEAGDVWQ